MPELVFYIYLIYIKAYNCRLYDEVQRVVGDHKFITAEHLNQLEYMTMVRFDDWHTVIYKFGKTCYGYYEK